jgi:hypothetical protein
MEHYLNQLLGDIAIATENSGLDSGGSMDIWDWISEEEESNSAPVRKLEEWSGIRKEMLPPANMLNAAQLKLLLNALIKMLEAYNCHFVLQIETPKKIQYECIRQNWDQDVLVRQWHMGFFDLCKPGTEHYKCALGSYCDCGLFAELFKDFVDEDLSPEEECARMLEMEIQYLKRKYDGDWMKYYPYHLDADYDDEYGNPYDYGFGEDEEEDDDWWRR